jgi:predicted RND superfamily exporter protein
MIFRFLTLGLRHRTGVTIFLFLTTLVAALGLPRLTVDTGLESLIPERDPARIVYQRIMGEFGTDNRTIVYVRDKALWTPAKLAVLEKIHRAVEQLEHVARVDGLYSLHTVANEGGRIESRPVLSSAPQTAEEAAAARAAALANPLYLGNYFSDNGDVTAMIVAMKEAEDDQDHSQAFYEDLEAVLEESRGQFEHLTQVGPPRVNDELISSLYQDFIILGPISAVVLVVTILFIMRTALSAVVPVATATITIIWTFGMLGWTGIPVNILSAMLPSLIIVIGSTEDTHMMSAFYRGLSDPDSKSRGDGVRYMARHMGLPLVLTVVTTAMGFGSNIFSNIGLIQDFSIASTFAMLANGLITALVMPILVTVYGSDRNISAVDDDAVTGLPGRVMRVFRYSQENYPLSTLGVTAALCAFFLYHAANLYVTNDPLSYFREDRPLIRDTRMIHEDLAGVRLFYISLESGTENAFLDPRNIAKLVEIQDFLKKQAVYDRSISIADHLAFVNREFRGEYEEARLPETKELVAQYLLFFHRGDLGNYVSHDYSRANIVVRHNISDSHTLNRYINELQDVADHAAGPGLTAHIVGENLMVNNAAESLMVGQVKALVSLMALIFLIMSAMFTSFKGGAIALVPAVIPIAMMFGIMGLLDIPLNPGTAMVAVIAIGIAVDGTIHLLARYSELCRRTSDYVGAVNTAVKEEATPLITSSFALALGFGVLLFSNFTVIAQFGALAAATMLFSIFANLLVTPIIMARVRLVGLYQILSMTIDRAVLEQSPLLRDMTDYQRRKAILISELHEFEAGDLLVEQNTVGRSMYLILAGEAEVIRRDGGKAATLATLHPGQVFGEIGFIRAMERTADVRALSKISALRFDYDRMHKDLKFFPNIVAKLNFNICYILGERLAEMVEKAKK